MPVPHGLGINVAAGVKFYRITSRAYWSKSAKHHKKAVSGDGAVFNPKGARYNYPGARTVYLAEDLRTCFAEKMFYFHREILVGLDSLHLPVGGMVPPFRQSFALWEITLRNHIPNVFDLSTATATAAGVFPCLLLNPSQDYWHLKSRRADVQASGYQGIRAPSARTAQPGNILALFNDQSANLASINPYEVEFRLITPGGLPFVNHVTDELDYRRGEVQIIAPPGAAIQPPMLAFAAWQQIDFNH